MSSAGRRAQLPAAGHVTLNGKHQPAPLNTKLWCERLSLWLGKATVDRDPFLWFLPKDSGFYIYDIFGSKLTLDVGLLSPDFGSSARHAGLRVFRRPGDCALIQSVLQLFVSEGLGWPGSAT